MVIGRIIVALMLAASALAWSGCTPPGAGPATSLPPADQQDAQQAAEPTDSFAGVIAHIRTGNYESAVADSTAAIAAMKDRIAIYAERASTSADRNDHAEAVADHAAAIALLEELRSPLQQSPFRS